MTKIKELTGSPVRVLVVDVPELETIIEVDRNAIYYHKPNDKDRYCVFIPPGNWTILTTDPMNITEDEALRVVHSFVEVDDGKVWYREYGLPEGSLTMSATESLHSLLKANRVLLENPYGEKEPESCGCHGPCGLKCNYADWHSAEANVFRHPVVLIGKKP